VHPFAYSNINGRSQPRPSCLMLRILCFATEYSLPPLLVQPILGGVTHRTYHCFAGPSIHPCLGSRLPNHTLSPTCSVGLFSVHKRTNLLNIPEQAVPRKT
jgi:hypothetical protein